MAVQKTSIEIKSEEIIKSILCKYVSDSTKVFLFGSRATDIYSHSSDYDIGILNSVLSDRDILKIKEEIAETIVPFKVDIVNFDMADEAFRKKAMERTEEWKLN